jgi:hypothetical protein
MTPPHLHLYIEVEETNEWNDEEVHAIRGICTRHTMSETHASTEDHNEPGLYEILIEGHVDGRWAARFEGLTVTLEDNGETRLTGPVVDQAALHGLLRKVRDLGMPLVSVTRVRPGQAPVPDHKP